MPENDRMKTALLYAAAAAAAFSVGGAIGAWRRVSPRVTSWLLHFAAGVVFAVLAVELLPQVRTLASGGVLPIAVGFAGGAIAMVLLGWAALLTARGPGGLILATAIDIALDGVLIGVGFAGVPRAAKLVALGIAIELVPLGLSVAAALRQGGQTAARTLATCGALALLPLAGAAASASLAEHAPQHILAGMLAFGAAALLYLVTEELLIEAHEHPQGRFDTALFFGGFGAVLLLDAAGAT
jgi:ZIP family zinc transporter